jgi:hypothetical protein
MSSAGRLAGARFVSFEGTVGVGSCAGEVWDPIVGRLHDLSFGRDVPRRLRAGCFVLANPIIAP